MVVLLDDEYDLEYLPLDLAVSKRANPFFSLDDRFVFWKEGSEKEEEEEDCLGWLVGKSDRLEGKAVVVAGGGGCCCRS